MVLDQNTIYALSLGGVALDALGGLYLAYDLFGGQRGALRVITKVASYGLVIGVGYGLPLGIWFGLAGGLIIGPALGLEFSWRPRGDEGVFEALFFSTLRAAALGVAGALSVNERFGISFAMLTALFLGLAYATAGTPAGNYGSSPQPGINRQVLVAAGLRGLALAVAAVISGAIARQWPILVRGIEIAVVAGSLSTLFGAISPSVEWWADNLPARRLGAYGAGLVVIGSVLQALQYLVPLLRTLSLSSAAARVR